MVSLIPWSRKKEPGGNGGSLARPRDVTSLMRRLHSDFDELFDRFSRNWFAPLEDIGPAWNWGLDIDDKGDSLIIRAEAPGFEADDFEVSLSGDYLTLHASKKSEAKEKGGEYHERCECHETLALPPGTDKEHIDATYRNGVLTLTIPKTKEAMGKKIAVKAG